LTYQQLLILYEENQLRKVEEYKILANIHGIDIDANKEITKGKEINNTFLQFGDPKEYDNLSKKEREKLTEKMLKQHRQWSTSTKVLGG
jgi:hypothetical protein